MVTTIAYLFLVAVVAFCVAPVSKVIAAIKWLKGLAVTGKEKVISRSQEWQDAFKSKGKITVVEEDNNDE